METNPDPEIKRIIMVDKNKNKNEKTKKVATTTKEKKDRVVTQTKK